MFHDGNNQKNHFDMCSGYLVLVYFAGYKKTILACGQTGPDKSHTVGTSKTVGLSADQVGILPRVFDFIFEEHRK